MQQCPNCGKEVKPDAKFCVGCGTKLVKPVQETPEPEVIEPQVCVCQNCGEEVKPDAAFCMNCGAALQANMVNEQTTMQVQPNTGKSDGEKLKDIIVPNAVFFILCVGLAILLYNITPFLGFIGILGTVLLAILPVYVWKIESINYFAVLASKSETLVGKTVNDEDPNDQMNSGSIAKQKVEIQTHVAPSIDETQSVEPQSTEQTSEPANTVAAQPAVGEVPNVDINITNSNPVPVFKEEKRGGMINVIILAGGMAVIVFVLSMLKSSGMGSLGTFGMGSILVISFILDLIYYLPTLMYHASFGGKLLMFLINSMFAITVIGWIVLLIIASSRNNKSRYNQELMHYIKYK